MAKNIDGPTNQDNETITKKNPKEFFDAKIWNAIGKNYEMIQGAQISNSFILLMVLNEATQPLSTTKISELISKRSKGQIYKISATVRDSLQYRLKREGYVEGVEVKDKSLYSITPKGKKLLEGWIAFLSAYR
jgi:DNA-binding PadR family transcriptional regulator